MIAVPGLGSEPDFSRGFILGYSIIPITSNSRNAVIERLIIFFLLNVFSLNNAISTTE